MIVSFGNSLAESVFYGHPLPKKFARKFPNALIQKARLKLLILHKVNRIEELFFPPSNHFEALSGNLESFYSIRIHQKPWRIIFRWFNENPHDVQIVDYH